MPQRLADGRGGVHEGCGRGRRWDARHEGVAREVPATDGHASATSDCAQGPHPVQPHTPIAPVSLGPRTTSRMASQKPLGWAPRHPGDNVRLGVINPDAEMWDIADVDDMANFRAMGAIKSVAICDLPPGALKAQTTVARVYKFKTQPDSSVVHMAKSRHCLRGDRMIKGVHFNETASNSPTPTSVRAVLSILARENLSAASRQIGHMLFFYMSTKPCLTAKVISQPHR